MGNGSCRSPIESVNVLEQHLLQQQPFLVQHRIEQQTGLTHNVTQTNTQRAVGMGCGVDIQSHTITH